MPEAFRNLVNRLVSNSPTEVFVELALIALAIHWCTTLLQGTRGTRPLRGLLVILIVVTLVVRILSAQLGWTRLELLYHYFVVGLAFIALVAFQPELRRAVIRAGDVRLTRRGSPQSKLISTLVKSAGYLSKNRYGALIAIERTVNLQGWADNGTIINAEISPNLLNNIFFPNSPLHDLGVIVRGNKVAAANCQFPVADSDEIDSALGSRHLAALAMSYESDALVLVISEETGTISIADDGKLTRYLSLDDLTEELTNRLETSNLPARRRRGWRQAWRLTRHALLVVGLTLPIWFLADQASRIELEGVKILLHIEPKNPTQIVDADQPSPAVFSATLRGAARSIDPLRSATAESPAVFTWLLPEDLKADTYTRSAKEILENLPAVRARALMVVSVTPETMRMTVHEKLSIRLPVVVDAGSIAVSDVAVTPSDVQVTMRARDYQRLSSDRRVVIVEMADRLRGLNLNELHTFDGIPVEDQVGGFAALIDPREVAVTLRVVGERLRTRIAGVAVRYAISPRLLDRYRPEPRDENEFLIELEVEGDKAVIESLQPRDVQAFAPIDSRLEPATAEYRAVEVQCQLPPGVTLFGRPPDVHVRLVPLEGPVP